MAKKKWLLFSAVTLMTGSVLAACSDSSSTNNLEDEDEFKTTDELMDKNVSAVLTDEQIDSCTDWQYDEENEVFECKDTNSEYFGQYYFNGFLFGTLTGLLVSNAFTSGKKTNHYIPKSYTSKKTGIKSVGGTKYSQYKPGSSNNTNNSTNNSSVKDSNSKGNSSTSKGSSSSSSSSKGSSGFGGGRGGGGGGS